MKTTLTALILLLFSQQSLASSTSAQLFLTGTVHAKTSVNLDKSTVTTNSKQQIRLVTKNESYSALLSPHEPLSIPKNVKGMTRIFIQALH